MEDVARGVVVHVAELADVPVETGGGELAGGERGAGLIGGSR